MLSESLGNDAENRGLLREIGWELIVKRKRAGPNYRLTPEAVSNTGVVFS